MRKVAVLGAGYMGSAITFPLSLNGVNINLWGTWLDDEIIASCRRGYHPKLKKALSENVDLYTSEELKDALKSIDFAIIAVTSEGFLTVFKKVIKAMDKNVPFYGLTKGLLKYNGRIERISKTAEEIFKKQFPDDEFIWASIGGPVKAVELSNRIPTATIYGTNSSCVKNLNKYFATEYYKVFYTTDVIGVEVSSAFKNVYSIALGICDGLYESGKMSLNHNLRAFLFNQAVREMAYIVKLSGGKKDTALNLAGIGDLHVTSSSGRNRTFGVLIGMGIGPDKAYNDMCIKGEIAEGYNTLETGMIYLKQIKEDVNNFPLFDAVYDVVFRESDPFEEIRELLRILGE